MCAGRNEDESQGLSNASGIIAAGFSGQHAIDAWESEGGGPAGALDGHDLARTVIADNARWLAPNNAGWLATHSLRKDAPKGGGTPAVTVPSAEGNEEDQILRCLGAAVIMRWNTIPTKLQRELFDNASSMGELLQADALKGQIARFLHKHKDDTR